MAVFAIYKYFFKQGQTNLVNATIDVEHTFAHAQELFGSLFPNGKTIKIPHTTDSGEVVVYNADIQIHKNDIVIFTLQNEKEKTIHTRNYSIEKHFDYPYCKVIIDNRPEVGQIAIERSSAFSSKTSKVFEIIFPYLKNKMLDDFHLDFELKMKYKSGDFWNIIHERRKRFNDPIKSVKFDFDNPKNKKPADTTADMAAMMIAMASASGADSATFLMRASAEHELEIARTNEHLSNLVDLCANNSYTISVNFMYHGLYNYGAKEKAMVIMSDLKMIDEFISPQTTIANEPRLIWWLDAIRDQTADYEVNND